MPTREAFELGATLFDAAADQVGGLAAELAAARTDHVIVGGVLGQAVPNELAQAASTLHSCVGRLSDAAALCRTRAAAIAQYELAYEAYRVAYQAWEAEQAAALMALLGGGGLGGSSLPPEPPARLPPWADVPTA